MTVKIITVGTKPSPELTQLITAYQKRFPTHVSVSWIYLKHGDGSPANAIKQESDAIRKALRPDNFTILLDEAGEQFSSEEFSKKIFSDSRDYTFIIGGAYGVNDTIKDRSDLVLSLSKLVFPHQLVRLLLIEQLYRGHTISIHHPYHHS